ncbi:hypothetical protein [Methylophaga thalassica]|uniref:hypothetical protein n=1 Tax=Methylophaga aminisulfidivorans TaxID=230105 RepID=UPI0024E265C8|nr:hypothetical protein [Methylophaga aminisulfidivorans]
MPNSFAYLVLFSWPLIVVYLLNRFNIGFGTLFTLLGAYMFLPANMSIDLPGLPNLDKFSITTITIIFVMLLKRLPLGIKSLPSIYKFILAVFFLAPFLTAITNSERYLHLPALSLYDGLTSSLVSFLYFFPFLIGVRYFRTEDSHIKLFKYFALAALVYSAFALYEIRMSPQLHSMIYGYFPHSWRQQYRAGGFRAVVFMGHGLLVAMFLALGVAFWTAMKKAGNQVFRYSTNFGLAIVFITLVFMKSYAAFVYGLFAYGAIRFLPQKQQFRIAFIFAVIFISYPLLSATGLFPHKELISFAEEFSVDRAGSLNYRFENENALLAHANQKPLFGWGGWGRNRIFDIETGEDISVTDGYWIIILGTSGWVGFLSKFLFFFLPLWLVYKKQSKMNFKSDSDRVLLAAMALIVSLILLDQLPNSSLSNNSLYWLLAGSLLGRAQELLKSNTHPIDVNEHKKFNQPKLT